MSTIATKAPTTTEAAIDPAMPIDADQRVSLFGIGWEGFEVMARLLEDRPRPQVVYLDGNLHLMTTTSIHERLTERLGMFVRVVVEELDIACEPTRETTFRRHDIEVAVQPDDSFYLANHAVVAALDGKIKVDLDVDPPPDLVIEAVHGHPATEAVEVLRRLGVPEVWVGDAKGLRIFVLGPDGRYADAANSRAFPFLTAFEILKWAGRTGYPSATRWTQDLRRWVREVLLPRHQQRGG